MLLKISSKPRQVQSQAAEAQHCRKRATRELELDGKGKEMD
jgi:hypothetical protein